MKSITALTQHVKDLGSSTISARKRERERKEEKKKKKSQTSENIYSILTPGN